MTEIIAPICDYCGQPAALKPDSEVYDGRSFGGKVWHCAPCDAWTSCHKGTHEPFGRMANAELRTAKMEAHAAFDPQWRGARADGVKRSVARNAAYAWLAEQLGLRQDECHFSRFDVALCRRVIEVCRESAARMAA